MGEVVQFRDYQNPKDLARMYSEQTLEQQAIEIMNVALMGEPTMVGMEPVVYLEMETDTAPSEYTAPLDDPA